MGLAILIAAGFVLFATLELKTRQVRRRRRRAYRSLFPTPPRDRGPAHDPNQPCDAIPAGYPGYKGSIRYTPYTQDAITEEK